ncbi:MAG: replication initiator protein [Microvirus sp.]|nr:MAG: replication initiator protein [Microvirus sp.]
MSCYSPGRAWKRADGGPLSFHEVKGSREIQIKCGQCIGCRISRREQWAVRCYAESKSHERNSFVTLTYDREFLPRDGGLDYNDVQLFFKRLRKFRGSFRYFVCGEYGDEGNRPHYHCLFFGLDFPDSRSLHSDTRLAVSEELSRVWGKGYCTVGDLTYASARYTASYCMKKVTGQRAEEHYSRVDSFTGEITQIEPEFCHMSLKPGIGFSWLEKYWREVYLHHGVLINGTKKPVPRYFDKKMDEILPVFMDDIEFQRALFAEKFGADQTPERLQVREAVEQARLSFERNKHNKVFL